jgi:hypothetical protein
MTLEVRRIVTGHDEFGKGIVVSDEELTAVSRGLGAGISGCEIWSTNSMPVDNSMEADAAQRAGFVKKYKFCRQRPGESDADCRMGDAGSRGMVRNPGTT